MVGGEASPFASLAQTDPPEGVRVQPPTNRPSGGSSCRFGTLRRMPLDVYPVTVRGPIKGENRQGVATFARLFEHDGHLYLAQSRTKGRTVTEVTRYELPEGKPTRPGRQAKWGQWVYSSCGCANSWRTHSIESLVALAKD